MPAHSRSIALRSVALLCLASVSSMWTSPARAADEKKAPELPARNGAEFERSGIQVVLTVTQSQVTSGKPLEFEVTLENRSKEDRTFFKSPAAARTWQVTMTDAAGQVWQAVPPPLAAAAAPPEGPLVLKAGEKQTVKFALGELYRFRRQGGGDGAFPLLERLPNGKYTLNVQRTFHGVTENVQIAKLPPLWVAEVTLQGATFTTRFDAK